MSIERYTPPKTPGMTQDVPQGLEDISIEDLIEEEDLMIPPDPEDTPDGEDTYFHYENLAENIPEDELNEIAAEVIEQFNADQESRAEWLETLNQGLSLLGVRLEETDDPFPGACSAHHPLILESAVKFQAKASNELFNPKGPVKTRVIGDKTEEKEEQAKRVRNHMNFQVMDEMEEFFEETEQMLFYLPIVGSGFKKTYYSSLLKRPVSEFIPIDQFVVAHSASNLKNVPAFSHVFGVTENTFAMDVDVGLYRDVNLGDPQDIDFGEFSRTVNEIMGYNNTKEDQGFIFIEQYCYLDLEQGKPDDYEGKAKLPYVVTVDKYSEKVLSIRRNWREYDTTYQRICPFTHYKFVPGMGFYGLGYLHLLGNLQMTLTSTMRSLVDSGQFSNLNAGFVDKRLRVKTNDGPLGPGQYKEVESGGLPLKEAIHLLPTKEPSHVLLQMYQFIEARGQKFADSTEQVVADSTNYGPVGTTMALLEASTKFFSGVHKRLHRAQKGEFNILMHLNYEYLDEYQTIDTPQGSSIEIYQEDYDGRVDVIPLSDPNMASQSQRMSMAQAVQQNALQFPHIHDLREVSLEYYSALGIDDQKIEKMLPVPEEPEPKDPLSDIMSAQQGEAIKAFPGQDHDSHITIKSAFLQDPQSGANPVFQQIAPVIQANIQEHFILKFREQVSAMVAQGQQDQEQGMSEAVVAQAAQTLSQNNQRLAQLEEEGVDSAKTKLAEAEILRAQTQSTEAQAKIDSQMYNDQLKALKYELDQQKEQNRMLIAGMEQETKRMEAQLKEQTDLFKEMLEQVNNPPQENSPVIDQ